ncbi:MAG: hypothetical protein R6W48_09145 [Gaiellaceae bacterium]
MRAALPALAAAALLVALGTGAAVASPSVEEARIQATLVGDSVSASISYVPTAEARLRRGLSLRLDAAVCRRLVQPSCTSGGQAPASALQAVRSYGRALGDVLVVNVGHNEDGRGYGIGIDQVLRAALSQGAKGVVWVTLREQGQYAALYAVTNRAIRRTAKRWPQMQVADWNAHGAGKPWFGTDGLHLSPTGAAALAAFLRAHVLRAARAP